MFRGEFTHSMDSKGRIVMPAKFREGLGTSFIVTRGMDKCLLVYTMPAWEIIESKASQLPITDRDARRFLRYFIGAANEAEPDAQGRFIIPQSLREHADLKKDVVSLGLSNRIEIWSKKHWDEYYAQNDIDDALAEKMSQLGI
ncbi:MAG: division/cell wall cluster transcriptional repressor MraZ [Clostridiales bacterium]|jgi:MraZ protein|nr:division/cell wall cluster transcriptional repressor MraZ [Clostridiales bacterium]